jgi:tRNA A-37 threonylcarbamoyl transferase component Bud32
MVTEKDLGQLVLTRHNKKIYSKDGIITKLFDSKFYQASDVLKEAMNQEYAVESSLPAPHVDSVFMVGKNWAISSDEIKGKTLAKMMGEDPANKKKYIDKLVQIQISILSHLSDNLKLPKLKDKLNNYITDSGLDATTRYDLHVRLEKMPNHYKFCHGDLTPQNIIFEGDKAYVLDWAHATRGNASADAAMTYLMFTLEGDDKGASMYLKDFCKKSDTRPEYVQSWISVVSATKLCTISDPKQRELLMRNINVVEY